MSPEEELARAHEARAFLEHSPFTQAVQEVEQALLDGIKRSPIKDSELREKLCQQYMVLQTIVDRIKSYVETGKLAEYEITQKNWRERLKIF